MAISFGGFEMKNTSVMMVTGVLLLGCASVDSVRDAPTSKGEERIFEVGYKRMVDVVSTTLPSVGMENVEKQSDVPQVTVFLGTAGVDLWSWGEIVRVTVTEIDSTSTSVRVYWRHKLRDGVISFAPNWTEDVFTGIEERLP
jgi:hypothetical protein